MEYLSLYFAPIPLALFIATGNELNKEVVLSKALRRIVITICAALGIFTLYFLFGFTNLNQGLFIFFLTNGLYQKVRYIAVEVT